MHASICIVKTKLNYAYDNILLENVYISRDQDSDKTGIKWQYIQNKSLEYKTEKLHQQDTAETSINWVMKQTNHAVNLKKWTITAPDSDWFLQHWLDSTHVLAI